MNMYNIYNDENKDTFSEKRQSELINDTKPRHKKYVIRIRITLLTC